jgi:hypothetical protein
MESDGLGLESSLKNSAEKAFVVLSPLYGTIKCHAKSDLYQNYWNWLGLVDWTFVNI